MSMCVDIVKREALTPDERQQMYAVFARYYENVDAERFDIDLDAKDWIIQLRNAEQAVVGFSTLQMYPIDAPCGAALILYSGDTIVDRAYRTSGDLAGGFGHFLIRALKQEENLPIYWFLTSKGVRTYRFLPVFFDSFFPAHDAPTPPAVKQLIDTLATAKFGEDYTSETQIVAHHQQRDWLCESEHAPALMKRTDPHIRFFQEKNPGYANGDELACLAEIARENLNARAWRVITHTKVNWRE